MIEIVALQEFPEVSPGDDLVHIIANALARAKLRLTAADAIVVTSKIVSKAENRFVKLADVGVSVAASELSQATRKDARLVQLILNESSAVVRSAPNVLITRHRLGLVMANAGIDASNTGPDRQDQVLLLPRDPDASAAGVRRGLMAQGCDAAVILSDSFGRPWRLGVVNVAIGASGVLSLVDRRGERDRDGRTLEVTQVAQADMIASAAGLLGGEGSEGCPVIVVRNALSRPGDSGAATLIRQQSEDLFS